MSVVKHGRLQEAERAVQRLQAPSARFEIPTPQETVALLVQTDDYEKELTHGVGYLECFKGVNLRRTEIAVGTWIVQQMCGPVLQTYAIYFFEQAGLPAAQAFNMTLGLVGLPLCARPALTRIVRNRVCRNYPVLAPDQPIWPTNHFRLGSCRNLHFVVDRRFRQSGGRQLFHHLLDHRIFHSDLYFHL